MTNGDSSGLSCTLSTSVSNVLLSFESYSKPRCVGVRGICYWSEWLHPLICQPKLARKKSFNEKKKKSLIQVLFAIKAKAIYTASINALVSNLDLMGEWYCWYVMKTWTKKKCMTTCFLQNVWYKTLFLEVKDGIKLTSRGSWTAEILELKSQQSSCLEMNMSILRICNPFFFLILGVSG